MVTKITRKKKTELAKEFLIIVGLLTGHCRHMHNIGKYLDNIRHKNIHVMRNILYDALLLMRQGATYTRLLVVLPGQRACTVKQSTLAGDQISILSWSYIHTKRPFQSHATIGPLVRICQQRANTCQDCPRTTTSIDLLFKKPIPRMTSY